MSTPQLSHQPEKESAASVIMNDLSGGARFGAPMIDDTTLASLATAASTAQRCADNPWLNPAFRRQARAYARAVAKRRAGTRPLSELRIVVINDEGVPCE
ncbi:hypothetical protein [Dyella psychrodurans]|uniref:Uncharacterized protein n=1 Tax=Dyella psychrodurans TaxID=1927960 RepID=A0A370XCF2_9GAMM|nr:hypothetical protein [Dyella psychrodurans]RDS85901.1 hypothetical protein DWU99_01085 [Dyella psychrodurans]